MHSKSAPNPHAETVWTRLVRASTRVQAEIEATLKAAGLPPLDWYDALWEIEKAAPDGLRQFALQERLLLPQYGLSRLIGRIAEAGLITRTPCPEDGRGQILALTEAGAAARKAMWPVYAAAMEQAIGTRLTGDDARRLADMLARLV
ncbi:MarR family winged helix-turn-helix transcriptional regulator [Defluviimonas aestuarii]|uniref:MarR family winged helix-turn-helix transcriptional regulator n=1 Tax=Albidovulum aestuarii TaxID=1130726 RepID=UPI00249A8C46|nr:MarR family winged helix-turn-helix transcriptional regulator [Defluviimonas aestuarii]MDI3335497.1 MarR family winged helix-turn-helix transcriptional regulator [Defluviimonas aestuarii]